MAVDASYDKMQWFQRQAQAAPGVLRCSQERECGHFQSACDHSLSEGCMHERVEAHSVWLDTGNTFFTKYIVYQSQSHTLSACALVAIPRCYCLARESRMMTVLFIALF